ncbi:regulatory-associated protein of mTOR [Trichonephila clavata]|uniref:Regulatory-associated protein of mTOR n=1 Tax=Trichonephila clavata TaxID=2740835 RepID=A0A8X6I6B2_TRICU|nr:regulatory-associated protein of mTOR [Trichonephila clavata]
MSEPSSPSGRPTFLTGDSPPSRMNGGVPHTGHDNSRLGKPANRWTESNAPYQQYQYFAQFNPIRKTFDKGPRVPRVFTFYFINMNKILSMYKHKKDEIKCIRINICYYTVKLQKLLIPYSLKLLLTNFVDFVRL